MVSSDGHDSPRPRWSDCAWPRGQGLTRFLIGPWPQIVQTRFSIAIFCALGTQGLSLNLVHPMGRERGQSELAPEPRGPTHSFNSPDRNDPGFLGEPCSRVPQVLSLFLVLGHILRTAPV